MKWINSRESTNVDDRRGVSGGGIAAGGGIIGIVVYIIYSLLGGSGEPPQIPQLNTETTQSQQLSPEEKALDDERAKFVKVVLAETEDVWNKLLAEQGQTYQEPVLVLYRGGVQSACGNASSAT